MSPPVAELESKKNAVAWRDLVALTKPRVTALVIATTAVGLRVVPARASAATVALAILGTVLVVGGANALNMYLERETDRRMERTKNRPLPAGRLSPRVALWFGVALSVASVPVLALGVNATTALLAVLANLSYVLAYTPLKQRSPTALVVGAVPGAMPPLLGWTAATGRVDAGGLVLFGILFFWQIPHFLAIATFRRADYARAGLRVLPVTHGALVTRHAIVRWTAPLVALSLLVVPLGLAHTTYAVVATLLGAGFLFASAWGLRPSAGDRWAKSLFAYSLVYLVVLLGVLVGAG